jgi:hypothetical protein
LADACVVSALAAASAALADAGLAPGFPLHLQHDPVPLARYYLRPLTSGAFYVAGPDATPDSALAGAELKLLFLERERLDFFEHGFDDVGLRSANGWNDQQLRGNAESITAFFKSSQLVTILSARATSEDLRDVATLVVRTGSQYPNGSCPAGAGRWSLSWAPVWRRVEPEEFVYMCLDEGEAYSSVEQWERSSEQEVCHCSAVWETPDARGVVSCDGP